MGGQWHRCGAMHHNPNLWRAKTRLKSMDISSMRIKSPKQLDCWEIDQDLKNHALKGTIRVRQVRENNGLEWCTFARIKRRSF